jgi:hypothetical protein
MGIIRTYSKLITLRSFEERFEYCKLSSAVGIETFGTSRFINQDFYRSKLWRDFRRHIIVRDNGFDLGHRDHPIADEDVIYVHHLNPLTIEQIMDDFDRAIDEENAISTMFETHQAIHYGSSDYIKATTFAERRPFDTAPWRK